jgi:hypothetical protein
VVGRCVADLVFAAVAMWVFAEPLLVAGVSAVTATREEAALPILVAWLAAPTALLLRPRGSLLPWVLPDVESFGDLLKGEACPGLRVGAEVVEHPRLYPLVGIGGGKLVEGVGLELLSNMEVLLQFAEFGGEAAGFLVGLAISIDFPYEGIVVLML